MTSSPVGRRELQETVVLWKMLGAELVISCLTDYEVGRLGLRHEAEVCAEFDILHFWLPFAPHVMPMLDDDLFAFLQDLGKDIVQGRHVLVHCRYGTSRSGLICAAALVYAGMDPNAAFAQVASAAGCRIPENRLQWIWLDYFAELNAAKLLSAPAG
jgi:protein-tyrosine phosphatase